MTCVRASRDRLELGALRRAADAFRVDLTWSVDTFSYLELRGARYEPLAESDVGTSESKAAPPVNMASW